MASKLDQLRKMTVVVGDTGDIEAVRSLRPEDCTTNPSIVLKAVQSPAFADHLTRAVAAGRGKADAVQAIADDLTVSVGAELAALVPGRVSTEVDARLSFDKDGSIAKARALVAAYADRGIGRDRVLVKLASTWEGIQAARVLEHEGLLAVRRGPGGGYYGQRPDSAALERALSAYMRTEPSSWEEALDMTSLLFNELAAAAARCRDAGLLEELRGFLGEVDRCAAEAGMAEAEQRFQDLLFRMVNRPLFELLTRVTLGFASSRPAELPYRGLLTLDLWREGRRRIIAAILAGDEELSRFEAEQWNRRVVLGRAAPS